MQSDIFLFIESASNDLLLYILISSICLYNNHLCQLFLNICKFIVYFLI